MRKALNISVVSAFFVLCLFSLGYSEQITITTYYPSPFGSYNELRVNMMAVGSGFASPALTNGYLFVEGRIGIGTATPGYQLELSTDSAAKPISNTWIVASDRRVKKDIQPFEDGLETIKQINPVRYKLNGKAGLPLDEEGISVIAQDVKEVVPYTIKTWKAKLETTDKEETELYNFDSGPLTFVLINAIKEQQAEIEFLKKEVNELKNKGKKR